MKDLLPMRSFVSNFRVKTPSCKKQAVEQSLVFPELVKFKVNGQLGQSAVMRKF